MYVQRLLSSVFKQALEGFPSVLITGPRQSGKTTFVVNEVSEAGYISFDDPIERDFAREDPIGFIRKLKGRRVIIDEVQYVPEIVQFIKMEIDRNRHTFGRWILTGSQHFNLMKEVTESLAGRVAILELQPFSLKEAFTVRSFSLEEVLWCGLYPEMVLHPHKRDLWIRSYIKTYIERDVRQLMNIKDLRVFEGFLGLLGAYHGQVFNSAALSREVGVSMPTIKSWAGVLEASYIIYFLRPYYKNFGKRVIKSPKLYFIDPAIVAALTRQPSAEAMLRGPMGGVLFEGIIIADAVKAYLNAGLNPDVFFWRSHDGLEVDLLLLARGKLHPVEIKLTSTPTSKHVVPLERFKKLASTEASDTGVVVCNIDTPTPLPHGNIAIPWAAFYEYVSNLISR